MNKLVECEVFIDPVKMECSQLKDEFLFKTFAAFCVPVVCRIARKLSCCGENDYEG